MLLELFVHCLTYSVTIRTYEICSLIPYSLRVLLLHLPLYFCDLLSYFSDLLILCLCICYSCDWLYNSELTACRLVGYILSNCYVLQYCSISRVSLREAVCPTNVPTVLSSSMLLLDLIAMLTTFITF